MYAGYAVEPGELAEKTGYTIKGGVRPYKADEIEEQRLLYSGHAMPPIEDGRPYVECR